MYVGAGPGELACKQQGWDAESEEEVTPRLVSERGLVTFQGRAPSYGERQGREQERMGMATKKSGIPWGGWRLAGIVLSAGLLPGVAGAQTPEKGAAAPDFTLSTPAGAPVDLAQDAAKGATVLVMLRGYPGYQCPYCVKQVHDFVDHSEGFAAKHAHVLFVYPGPPAELNAHAKEFLEKQANLPPDIQLVVDPDYKVTNLYGLRWDAPHETAYPATFILDPHRTIAWEKVSHTHGDRTTAEEVLAELPAR